MSIYKGTEFIAGTPDLSEYAKSSDVTSAINTLDSTVVKLTGNQTIAGTKTFSSAVKCAGSATTGTAITTSAISKAQNGYVKLGNGIIIQWGQIAGNSNTRHNVTLPTAFTSTNYTVCSSNTTFGDSAPWGATIEQTTTTTFKIFQVHKQKIWWMAIGY
jgi:hypothetical protein